MTDQTELIQILNTELAIALPQKTGLSALREKLSVHINHLIQTDFQKLAAILYRVDVSERKLVSLLQENPGADAGPIIADLIIERQLQKIKSRRQFRQPDKDIDENEKW
jgi:hypothetical protein